MVPCPAAAAAWCGDCCWWLFVVAIVERDVAATTASWAARTFWQASLCAPLVGEVG